MLSLRLNRGLAAFDLEVEVECRYPVTAIYGPSGAGKTSLLNMVAGLMRPDRGRIELDGEVLFDAAAGIDLPPEARRLGYVFQEDLLFPHLSAGDNLRFGYDLLPFGERRFEPERICELLEIGGLLDRFPATLSGGERQRVALGRALLSSPRLLLMDEPLASLDRGLKSRIIPYLRHVRSDLGIPILYVSHSAAEILELTGQVIVLDGGRVVAHGDFFRVACDPRVLRLVDEFGFENVLPVEILPGEGTGRRLPCPLRRAAAAHPALRPPAGDAPLRRSARRRRHSRPQPAAGVERAQRPPGNGDRDQRRRSHAPRLRRRRPAPGRQGHPRGGRRARPRPRAGGLLPGEDAFPEDRTRGGLASRRTGAPGCAPNPGALSSCA